MQEKTSPFRTYWLIWGALLVLTISMMTLELIPLVRALAVLLLLAAMMAKATFIGVWFMHLRHERPALAWTLVLVTMLTAVVLFALIAIDGATMDRYEQ